MDDAGTRELDDIAADGGSDAISDGTRTPGSRASSASVPLVSLASHYEEPHHKPYLQRLEEAVKDNRNRNIALTGRYGTGKSSVLDQFENNHKDTTLRLGISTLGPDNEDSSKTNRIQKELVKQLIYSASEPTLRRSRFSRPTTLSTRRAIREAAGGIALVLLLLVLLGWLPPLEGTEHGAPWQQKVAIWVLFAMALVAAATVLRRVMHEQFFVSDVSAAGAAVTLTKHTHTYFDEYLDEIVNYFDAESPEFVILEDLDRFNDPRIFEALRELNTLLNNTPKRVEKVKEGKSLRFIYAVRDSLFERLGTDTQEEGDDAATAETVRANRTKFFDVVIPMVPFISHRNARELLDQLLTDAHITDIDRPLVTLVAQHATDMRLLVNMRNEYLVFAERLLEADKQAPGLTPNGVFALVAYKNFHLGDFEQISRQGSDLDILYKYRRVLVRSNVARLEARKRDLLRVRGRDHAKADVAVRLGTRLEAVAEATKAASPSYGPSNYLLRYSVGDTGYQPDQISEPSFWKAVVEEGQVEIQATGNPDADGTRLLALAGDQLRSVFPEGLEAGRWDQVDQEQLRDELAQVDHDVMFLRGADFSDLAQNGQFTVTVPASGQGEVAEQDQAFSRLVDVTLKSDLAGDLLKRGHLDQNFALYAAQFYGDFTGVDVATFIVQAVQANTMEIDTGFTSPGAIENLLEEAGDDFTHTISAYNIAVLDHLLKDRQELAVNVVDHMISNFDQNARQFLAAYLSAGSQRTALAAELGACGWRLAFTHLASSDDVPDDVRPTLVDAALLGADAQKEYDLDSAVADYIVETYPQMTAFTAQQDESASQTVLTLLNSAGVLIPDLTSVHESLRARLVDQELYQLTAPNLRAALEVNGEMAADVSLDRVRSAEVVYRFCLANPGQYLAAVEDDISTPHTILTPDTLLAVLTDAAERWSTEHIGVLVAGAAPESALKTLTGAPVSTWPALAGARLFRASLPNVATYLDEVGSVDDQLGQFLVFAGQIDADEQQPDPAGGQEGDTPDQSEEPHRPHKDAVAVAILSARGAIESPEKRVALARSLDLSAPLPADRIKLEGGDLLALLIEHNLVEDDAPTFSHFRAAGWSALEPAIAKSENVTEFMTPDLINGMVAQLFNSPLTRDKVGPQVLAALAQYVPADDAAALTSAAHFAITTNMAVPLDQVQRVAATGPDARDATMKLLQMAPPEPTDIVATLNNLGKPYSYLSTREEAVFEVPYDDAHKAVFGVLKEADICSFAKKALQDFATVKIK